MLRKKTSIPSHLGMDPRPRLSVVGESETREVVDKRYMWMLYVLGGNKLTIRDDWEKFKSI